MKRNTYPTHNYHDCIDAYTKPENIDEWLECPRCNLKPRIWEFDNMRSTACGCWGNTYDHFSVKAKDIVSVMRESENGQSMEKYNKEELKDNWNKYVKTILHSTK